MSNLGTHSPQSSTAVSATAKPIAWRAIAMPVRVLAVIASVFLMGMRWWQATLPVWDFRLDDLTSLEIGKPLPKRPTETEALVARVRELVVVADTNQPTLLVLKNVADLKVAQPQLYQDAQDGDVMLVFSDQIVVYSPGLDKVVATVKLAQAAPAVTDTDTGVATTSATVSPTTQTNSLPSPSPVE